MNFLYDALAVIYFTAAGMLFCYGLNAYLMIVFFTRRKQEALAGMRKELADFGDPMQRDDAPLVVTQLPIYNEVNVCARAMCAAAEMQWPKGRHVVQVLDDSTDETRDIVDQTAYELRDKGHDVRVVRRTDRTGFKAGALAHGMRELPADIYAIFDADFVPPRDFLLKSAPFFQIKPEVGLVQARWGHLNRAKSLLTRAQSIGIDGHFMVEQSARTWNGLFMNFNGTAGLWRREAIESGGGWQWDTLTEDMDLSYRVQLKGWKTMFLPELVAPAEIPEDVSAFKSQQFRWAKGSIQTAKKIFPQVLRTKASLIAKVQAFFHLTHYLVHPLMLILSLLALPVLMTRQYVLGPAAFAVLAVLLVLAMSAPSTLYLVSQRSAYKDWPLRIAWLPALIVVGVGLAVSNTRAVLEAFAGMESPFVRTPKKGDKQIKTYGLRFPWVALVELGVGVYCSVSLAHYLVQGVWFVGPFLGVYSLGYLFIGSLTLLQTMGFTSRSAGAKSP
ncbi:MAG: glycosyltransferase [Desulfovibrio sp.]|nr:MAG: glycosyltransferase [Desulfovibrio sp.]